ncbi:uncharacterized protein K452DRAFT_20648 [Aplosporella prunicola CBS 121167]|uniref:Uncharacterized protein n=1 Tax=Aplosporella prunicola CBS 121167 TaxID=1176127 RepID=A0A6A6BEH2_9PEZI|nr:uncharacterized protein K452DRAFT_20648 [Aplosporella prunicola CBS 121167]KAF2142550.1 hypothetical protein K452DRAFT_20648 [Aplosporella prunicola CBS 121167]
MPSRLPPSRPGAIPPVAPGGTTREQEAQLHRRRRRRRRPSVFVSGARGDLPSCRRISQTAAPTKTALGEMAATARFTSALAHLTFAPTCPTPRPCCRRPDDQLSRLVTVALPTGLYFAFCSSYLPSPQEICFLPSLLQINDRELIVAPGTPAVCFEKCPASPRAPPVSPMSVHAPLFIFSFVASACRSSCSCVRPYWICCPPHDRDARARSHIPQPRGGERICALLYRHA